MIVIRHGPHDYGVVSRASHPTKPFETRVHVFRVRIFIGADKSVSVNVGPDPYADGHFFSRNQRERCRVFLFGLMGYDDMGGRWI